MTTIMFEQNNLKPYLDLLEGYLKEWCDGICWSRILITDYTNVVYGKISYISQEALVSPEKYTERFDSLLNEGYSWINMNAAGVLLDTLIVIIEYPNHKNNTPRDKISVNFSGPPSIYREIQWDISELFSIID